MVVLSDTVGMLSDCCRTVGLTVGHCRILLSDLGLKQRNGHFYSGDTTIFFIPSLTIFLSFLLRLWSRLRGSPFESRISKVGAACVTPCVHLVYTLWSESDLTIQFKGKLLMRMVGDFVISNLHGRPQ